MNESPPGANRLNHDDHFLPLPPSGEGREGIRTLNQPPQLTRHIIAEGGSKWFGSKPSRNGYSAIPLIEQPRDHRRPTTLDPMAPTKPISPNPDDDSTIESASEMQEFTGESIAPPKAKVGKPSNYLSNIRCDTSDPPHLVEENEGHTMIKYIIPSQTMEDKLIQSMEYFETNVVTPCRERKECTQGTPLSASINYVTAESSSMSPESYSIGDQNTSIQIKVISFNFDETKQHSSRNRNGHGGIKVTIITSISNHGCDINGRAIQTIELLRRCFYPRRDVIKWG